jgi:small subunit ribosomal protein S7
MARRRVAKKRVILPDSKHNDLIVAKFINTLMVDGKKSIAENIFYSSLDKIKEKTNKEGIDVFRKALDNIKPALEVKSRRIGGATYQVPVEVKVERAQTLALRWLLQNTIARKEYGMIEKLTAELIAAANQEGGSVKKKEDTHKMAEANRAFAHYKW